MPTWRVATSIVDVVKRLVTREISVRSLGGPIAITRASVAAAESGLETLLELIALLSVNVAVLELEVVELLFDFAVLAAQGFDGGGERFEFFARLLKQAYR